MIKKMIIGVPYCKIKKRGNKQAPKLWIQAVIDQTKNLEVIDYPCKMEALFLLPNDKYPKDFPCGPDLDNLLKSLLDGLQKTFLKNDSLIVELKALKKQTQKGEDVGVLITLEKYQRVVGRI